MKPIRHGASIHQRWQSRLLQMAVVALVAASASGCRICCNTDDEAYSAYGGLWERTNRYSGRVGSLADAGGARASKLSPRDSAARDTSGAQRQIAPLAEPRTNQEPDSAEGPDEPLAPPKLESEEEFRERMEEFKKNEMINAGIIPGAPAPPQFDSGPNGLVGPLER